MNPDLHFRPGTAPTVSERERLFCFALAIWRARRAARNAARNCRTVGDVLADFRHTLRQWRRIGEAKGNGNRARRRVRELARAAGPWLHWPAMTITAC